MRFSPLQKYILRSCYCKGQPKINRIGFPRFYDLQKQKPKKGDRVNIITKSLESLIDKELIVGYGVRTPHKWYIKEVKLMPKGRRLARQLLGEQQSLPFKINSKIKNQNVK